MSIPIYRICRNRDETVKELKRMFEGLLTARGLPLSKEVEQVCASMAEEQWEKMHEKISSDQPPQDLSLFLAARTKRIARKISQRLVITQSDFAALVSAAPSLGYRHSLETYEFRPPNVEIGENPFSGDSIRKDINKIKTIFEQRKQMFIHVFEKGQEWHIFYFTGSDLTGKHWEGEHLHYLGWHFGKERTAVMSQLRSKTHSINGDLHIRFKLASSQE